VRKRWSVRESDWRTLWGSKNVLIVFHADNQLSEIHFKFRNRHRNSYIRLPRVNDLVFGETARSEEHTAFMTKSRETWAEELEGIRKIENRVEKKFDVREDTVSLLLCFIMSMKVSKQYPMIYFKKRH
jgi:hypothetical protein